MKPFLMGAGLCLVISLASAHDSASYFNAKSSIASGSDINLYSHLSNHPLYPDLAATFYRRHLDRNTEIVNLFSTHYSARPVKKLHNVWIEKKYNEGAYQAIVDHYYNTGSDEAECAYRAAQLQLGNSKAALKNIYWTWMSSQSVSPICDSVFAAWPGSANPAYRLQRAKKAYLAGNADFARTLAERLPFTEADHNTMIRFADYLRRPETMTSSLPQDLTNSALAKELLPTALKKLIRIDSSNYAAFTLQFANTLGDNPEYQAVLSKLTEYLANRDDPQIQKVYALLSTPSNDATDALVRYLVARRDWQGIQNLVKLDTKRPMALYWLGRALEASGKSGQVAYQKAARTRTYYGFLAADKIGKPYQFTVEKIIPNTKAQSDLDQNRSLIRARLLSLYGEKIEARREIVRINKLMLSTHRRQLAYWLDKHGFHFEAIYILGKAKDWNDIHVRFPTPHNSAVENASNITGVQPTWIYAIMRQESSMDPNARSHAKARGLMQVIPSTARRMARQEGLSLAGDGLTNPMINTQLGAAYLANMFKRYNNLAMASAAYNAGPGRVDKWMLRDSVDMTIWVEKIPFKETRKYVKNILEYQQVYANHLGVSIPTATEILEGRYQAVR